MFAAFANHISSSHKILQLEQQLHSARMEDWLQYDLFSPQWWLLVTVLIVPWIIWWHYVNKRKLLEISLVGAIVLIVASYLDAVFSDMSLWDYHYHVVTVWPRLISADFTLLPVTYMMVYQYFAKWDHFILVMIVLSAVFSFAGEPLLIWLKIYDPQQWKHIYSFPIYITIGIFARWLIQAMLAVQGKWQQRAGG